MISKGIKSKFSFQVLFLARLMRRYGKKITLVSLATVAVSLIVFKVIGENLKENTQIYLNEGIVGTYTSDNLPIVVTNLLSKSLFNLDKSGNPHPNLLEKWEVSKDAKKYTLTLKNNITWLDGTKISAKDFDILIPDAKIKVLDDKKIEITLNDSFSPLPSLLTKPIFKRGVNLGTGPYFISAVEKNQIFIRKLILKSNDHVLPELAIRFYPSEKIAKNGLRIGEVQALLGINDTLDIIAENPFSHISKTNFGRLVAVFYNTKDPVLSDKNFRLALSFASPSIKNEVEAKTSIPTLSWAFNSDVKDFLDNPEQANLYLEKVKKGKDKPVVLTATSPLKEIGEKIVAEWNRLGIKAVLRVESGIPQNFQALLIAQDIPVDPDQYSLWHSTQTKTNISQYFSLNQFSPRVDKNLEDGRKTTDIKIRKARYEDLQRVLLDDAPATFLYFPKYNVVFLKKVDSLIKKVIDKQLVNLNII